MTQTKFDRPDGFGLKSRHEHQRHGGIFTAGTEGDCAAIQRAHDTPDCREAGRQTGGGPQLHLFRLPEGRIQHATGADRMGEGERAGRSRIGTAGNALRAESEDAGILRKARLRRKSPNDQMNNR